MAEKITNNQALVKMEDHLLKQGGRCMDRGSCCFFGKGGLRCAIGILIPEAMRLAVSRFRNTEEASSMFNYCAEKGYNFASDLDYEIMEQAQAIHDDYRESADDWDDYIVSGFAELRRANKLTLKG
jgi:hypothetical protein